MVFRRLLVIALLALLSVAGVVATTALANTSTTSTAAIDTTTAVVHRGVGTDTSAGSRIDRDTDSDATGSPGCDVTGQWVAHPSGDVGSPCGRVAVRA